MGSTCYNIGHRDSGCRVLHEVGRISFPQDSQRVVSKQFTCHLVPGRISIFRDVNWIRKLPSVGLQPHGQMKKRQSVARSTLGLQRCALTYAG